MSNKNICKFKCNSNCILINGINFNCLNNNTYKYIIQHINNNLNKNGKYIKRNTLFTNLYNDINNIILKYEKININVLGFNYIDKQLILYIQESNIRQISTLSSYYNDELINQINNLFDKVIISRGDGNCYYRSIIFSLLYNILFGIRYIDTITDNEKQNQIIDNLNILKNIFNISNLNNFFDILIYKNIKISYLDFLCLYITIDRSIIEVSRRLLADYILKNIDTISNGGLTYNQLIMIGTDDKNKKNTIQKYIDNIIKMDVDAEGFHLELGILPIHCLNSKLNVIVLRNNIVDSFTILTPNNNNNKLPSTNIIITPGHYNIIIPTKTFYNTEQSQLLKILDPNSLQQKLINTSPKKIPTLNSSSIYVTLPYFTSASSGSIAPTFNSISPSTSKSIVKSNTTKFKYILQPSTKDTTKILNKVSFNELVTNLLKTGKISQLTADELRKSYNTIKV